MARLPFATVCFDWQLIQIALERGWRMFNATRPVSVTYAMIFAVVALISLYAVKHLNVAPMALPLAGGFMLIGPVLLVGYFNIADRHVRGEQTSLSDAFSGFRTCPHDLWVMAAVVMLIYVIWISDAATLYTFLVGGVPPSLFTLAPGRQAILPFFLWSSVMGAVLAWIIFAVTAFSVPLIYYRRAGLIRAVILSVKMVLANFVPSLSWAVMLAIAIIGSILVLPLFLVVFPTLAYASHALYQELFHEDPA